MIELKNGDIVLCKRLFGNMPLVYVGLADSLDHLNDCVVINNGHALPVQLADLIKVSE